jgi:hypothetical protein
MNALRKIAFYQNRRDEVPNQELAAELARTEDSEGIAEIATNLTNRNKSIQSDCLKVLYELGYLKPELIAGYADAFLDLLKSRNNRMVWGSMIALGTIASLKAGVIGKRLDEVLAAIENGSVITVDWGIRTLARVSERKPSYSAPILPRLKKHLETIIPRDVPSRLESMIPALTGKDRQAFARIAEKRAAEMTSSQKTRLRKVLRMLELSRSPAAR